MKNSRGKRPKHAFTLLELLLVLALIVTIVGLTVPALSTPLANHRLRRGAEQVRAEWAKARAKAMEQGRAYIFRYTPGSDSFSVEPWLSGDDYLESDQLTSLGVDASSGKSLALEQSLTPAGQKLPENVTFLSSATTVDMRAELLSAANPSQTGAVQQTPTIFFYPDGTTSTARLVMSNQLRYMTLTLRGFTGVVEVSGLQNQAEIEL